MQEGFDIIVQGHEEEEDHYTLETANKSDHNLSEKPDQYKTEDLHMVPLPKKGSHRVSVRRDQNTMLLPQRVQSRALKHHVSTATRAESVSSINMLAVNGNLA